MAADLFATVRGNMRQAEFKVVEVDPPVVGGGTIIHWEGK